MMSEPAPQTIEVGAGAAARRIAVLADWPATSGAPGVFWLSGFKSDMASTKATALAAWARETGFGATRFDYSGHGVSGGRFEDGTIGRWLEEAVAVFERFTSGPQVVVGSSMGGYIALLLLRRLMAEAPETAARIKALYLIAPAWDMTERLMWDNFPPDARTAVMSEGVFLRPSLYGDPYPITRGLIEDGRRHLIGDQPFDPCRPVSIIQGRLDPDVPWQHTERLVGLLGGGWTRVHWVEDGEHRLSRPEDLEVMFAELGRLMAA
jgi:pimeloyl-ACP methyl ester carboxylesterase